MERIAAWTMGGIAGLAICALLGLPIFPGLISIAVGIFLLSIFG